ncbi:MAG TPA: energy transducer TonB, partial [Terriglobales bacterium]|nr:energy transducer TonB [Terriglobales bacterium]
VPPPVSAPEQESNVNAKLLLPAPSVIAPPPTHVTRDVGSVGGSGIADNKQVVPPPVATGTRSLASQIWTGLFGGSDTKIVPPPVQDTASRSTGQLASGLGATAVVPPPVDSATRSVGGQMANGLGSNVVVPPPVAGGTRALNTPSGTLLADANVVPPPPSVGGGTSSEGRGFGKKGAGTGGTLDLGSAVAPPNSSGGGSGGGKGIVVSSEPGSKVGIPGNAGTGALAMSPSGTAKSGLGGSGAGEGIGRGNGPGSGFSGEGSGAGKEGVGRGSDPAARGGISPYPGSGGSGRGTNGTPAMPGVTVAGGSTINLPSFSADGNDVNDPSRSSALKERRGLGVQVVGSSRSGGAFNFYGALKGDNYTIYIPTTTGTVVMQFADPSSAGRTYAGDLTAPDPIRTDLPEGLQKSRMVVACILDRSGQLRDVKVLERGSDQMMAKILSALPRWKFQPAFRNGQPVEVAAYLGFNIDTR